MSLGRIHATGGFHVVSRGNVLRSTLVKLFANTHPDLQRDEPVTEKQLDQIDRLPKKLKDILADAIEIAGKESVADDDPRHG